MTIDWRPVGFPFEPDPSQIRLCLKVLQAPNPDWDHDHCAACWRKIVEPGSPEDDVAHEGYATCADYVRGAEYDWVCVPCFQEFAAAMEWTDATRS